MRAFLSILILFVSPFALAQTAIEIKSILESNYANETKLLELYKIRNQEPIWLKESLWTSAGQQLRSLTKQIQDHGLNPKDYSSLDISNLPPHLAELAQTEIHITQQVIKLVDHLSNGRVAPEQVSADIKFKRKTTVDLIKLNTEINTNMTTLLDAMAPKTFIYQDMKAALAKLREISDSQQWQTITQPKWTNYVLGSRGSLLAKVKNNLKLLGYPISTHNLYDTEFDNTLKDIQKNLLIPQEKGLNKNSKMWKYFVTPLETRVTEVILQMEKARWLPNEFERRYIYVNLANQMFRLKDTQLQEQGFYFEFRNINGQVLRKTPAMKDKLYKVVFNPTWTVPFSIFFNDKLPLLQKDSTYASKYGYRFYDLRTDQEILGQSIDWTNVKRENIYFQMVQRPSIANALGVVKFPMTNAYSIYLHDTNDRTLFKNNYRLLSSGCVRLQKPLELAEYLLRDQNWSMESINEIISTPEKVALNETEVRLKSHLPVYLLGVTVERSQDGIIRFFDDYYGQNQDLYKALTQI